MAVACGTPPCLFNSPGGRSGLSAAGRRCCAGLPLPSNRARPALSEALAGIKVAGGRCPRRDPAREAVKEDQGKEKEDGRTLVVDYDEHDRTKMPRGKALGSPS